MIFLVLKVTLFLFLYRILYFCRSIVVGNWDAIEICSISMAHNHWLLLVVLGIFNLRRRSSTAFPSCFQRKMSFPSALRGSESFESCLNRRNCTCGVFDRFVTVEFFCGSSAECRLSWESSKDDPDPDLERKRKEVFQRTLTHIEKFYAAVLILENLKQSIQILEISLPQYFTGISGIDRKYPYRLANYSRLRL